MNLITGEKGVQIREMSPVQSAYLAGIIDGEGSIRIARSGPKGSPRPQYQACISVCSTDRELLEWIVSKTGMGRSDSAMSGHPNRKPAWQWSIHAKQVKRILDQVIEYLVIKRSRAELALQFLDHMASRSIGPVTAEQWRARESIYRQMRDLNRRGRQQVTDKTCHTPESVLVAA